MQGLSVLGLAVKIFRMRGMRTSPCMTAFAVVRTCVFPMHIPDLENVYMYARIYHVCMHASMHARIANMYTY